MANAGPGHQRLPVLHHRGVREPRPAARAAGLRLAVGGVCGYTRFGQGVCGCELVGKIAREGNSQTRLVKVTITSTPPACK